MRSQVFSTIGILLVCVLLYACQQGPDAEYADVQVEPAPVTVVHNARIYTMDQESSAFPDGAMAISSDGELLAVNSSQVILARFPDAALVDLYGQTVLPGLIDAHAHLAGPRGYAAALTTANLVGTSSKQEVLERLQQFESTLGPDDWLIGFGWDQNDWSDTEFPTHQDLDGEFPSRPVWLTRIDGHAAWGNSLAMAEADKDFSGEWNPQGGLIQRDSRGQATGIFVDNARALVDNLIPPVSEARLDAALDLALQNLLSLGLTGVHDAGLSRSSVEKLLARSSQGRLPLRVYAMADGVGGTLDWLCESGAVYDPAGHVLMRSVKLYGDGALGSRGAALLADYSDNPGNRGLLFNDDQTVQGHMRQIMSCGLQVAIHAIGDAGNRQALEAYQDLIPEFPDNPGRHRIEHAQILSIQDLSMFAQLDVIASMQPTHATSDMYWAEERVGPERILGAYAWRSLLDSGARLALGSDFPVEQVNPMLGIYAAVTRQDLAGWPPGGWFPAQRLSREVALRGFTTEAAYAAFMEDRVGSLEPGKRADFIVLDRDIMQVPEREIPEIQVLQAWVDGNRVFERN